MWPGEREREKKQQASARMRHAEVTKTSGRAKGDPSTVPDLPQNKKHANRHQRGIRRGASFELVLPAIRCSGVAEEETFRRRSETWFSGEKNNGRYRHEANCKNIF